MNKIKQGKKNRASGAIFEKRVRADLEEKGWIVDRWNNNVEFDIDLKEVSLCPGKSEHTTAMDENGNEVDAHFEIGYTRKGKLIQAKAKWNNFTKTMMMGKGGFPDFIAFKWEKEILNKIKNDCIVGTYDTFLCNNIGVEVKTNGHLDKQEKEKCQWLLENKIFSKILIAKKTKVKNRVVIEYRDFVQKESK